MASALCPSCLAQFGAAAWLGLPPGEPPDAGVGPPLLSFGDYELLVEAGRGGMGVVFKARQKSLRRFVALKLILQSRLSSAAVVRRFQIEAEAAAQLDHPNIVPIHEIGEHEGQHFYSMKLVEGTSLAHRLREGPLPLPEAARVVATIASAIHYAHQRGVIHRDIKPGNILLDASGQPHVTDFGLAKIADHDASLTGAESVMGSPSYMAPEQAAGKARQATTAADVYSLGAVLYECLTGQPPFRTDTVMETLRQVVNREPLPPSQMLRRRRAQSAIHPSHSAIDADLETICLKCLSKDPPGRYATAAALTADLERWLDGRPIEARPVTRRERLWRWAKRNPVLAGMGAAMLTLLLVLAIGSPIAAVRINQSRVRATREAARAEREELSARRALYAADMLLAHQAIEASDFGRARELLARHRPQPGEEELRGWEWRFFWQQCQSEAAHTLGDFRMPIFSVAVHPAGRWLVTGGLDGAVRWWDLETRREVLQFGAQGDYPLAEFSSSGGLLATSGHASETNRAGAIERREFARVWHSETRRILATLEHPTAVRSVAFSLDEKRLATLAADGRVRIWNLASLQTVESFKIALAPTPLAGEMVFTPDGRRLIIGGAQGRIWIKPLASDAGDEFHLAAERTLTALSVSPDGRWLAAGTGFEDGDLWLWELDTRTQHRLKGHRAWIQSVAFSRDGRQVASASADQTVRLWDVKTMGEVATLRGHIHQAWAVRYLADGQSLVSGGKDGRLLLWSAQPKTRPAPFVVLPERARALDFPPDGQTFVMLNETGAVEIRDSIRLQRTESLTALGTNHTALAFSTDGAFLALGHSSGNITLWDHTRRQASARFAGHTSAIGGLQFLEQNQLLWSTDTRQRTGKLWDLASRKERRSWAFNEVIKAWAFSPDGRWLVTGHHAGQIKFWNVATGLMEHDLVEHRGVTGGMAFSPDGRWLATSSEWGDTKIWDAAARRPQATLRGHLMGVFALAFSPDGRRLATAGGGKEAVKIWDVAAGYEVATLAGQGTVYRDIRFSPDGILLCALSQSGWVNFWRTPGWKEIERTERNGSK
jgi:WD40 repeat protein/tRNA A-37 threonylcarbamoyl transferase component Bud32